MTLISVGSRYLRSSQYKEFLEGAAKKSKSRSGVMAVSNKISGAVNMVTSAVISSDSTTTR